jgi:hypothetical protein
VEKEVKENRRKLGKLKGKTQSKVRSEVQVQLKKVGGKLKEKSLET